MKNLMHMTKSAHDVVFKFVYQPKDVLVQTPLKYQRCEIDFGGDVLADGLIGEVAEIPEEQGGGWVLTISSGPRHAAAIVDAIQKNEIAVRVVG